METTDIRSEAILLGAAMRSTDSLNALMDLGNPQLFQKESHQHIYNALTLIYNDNTAPTPNAVHAASLKLGQPVSLIDLLAYSYELSGDEDIRFFINRLKHLQANNTYFNAIQSAANGLERATDAQEETAKLFRQLEPIEIQSNHSTQTLSDAFATNFRDSGLSLKDYIDRKIHLQSQGITELSGLSTGYPKLDEATDGLQRSWFYVFGARPGEGKTQFLLNLIHNVVTAGNPVLFFSLEMPTSEVALELATIHSRTPHKAVSEGTVDPHDYQKFVNGLLALETCPLIIDDQPSLNTNQIRARIKRAMKSHDIKAVFLDYLQEIKSPYRHPNQQETMQHVTRELREMAKEFRIPLIVSAQVNRESEQTEASKPPLASHLRESGQIEQCAWFIGMLHRPDKNDPFNRPGLLDLHIRKNRFGKTGKITYSTSPDQGYSYRMEEYDL